MPIPVLFNTQREFLDILTFDLTCLCSSIDHLSKKTAEGASNVPQLLPLSGLVVDKVLDHVPSKWFRTLPMKHMGAKDKVEDRGRVDWIFELDGHLELPVGCQLGHLSEAQVPHQYAALTEDQTYLDNPRLGVIWVVRKLAQPISPKQRHFLSLDATGTHAAGIKTWETDSETFASFPVVIAGDQCVDQNPRSAKTAALSNFSHTLLLLYLPMQHSLEALEAALEPAADAVNVNDGQYIDSTPKETDLVKDNLYVTSQGTISARPHAFQPRTSSFMNTALLQGNMPEPGNGDMLHHAKFSVTHDMTYRMSLPRRPQNANVNGYNFSPLHGTHGIRRFCPGAKCDSQYDLPCESTKEASKRELIIAICIPGPICSPPLPKLHWMLPAMQYPDEIDDLAQLIMEQFVGHSQHLFKQIEGPPSEVDFIHFILAGRVGWQAADEPDQCHDLPPLPQTRISWDLDSAIGISHTLPYTSALVVWPIPPFREMLAKDNHAQSHAYDAQGDKILIPMHKIPNVPLGKVQQRHVIRIFLPQLYSAGSVVLMSQEDLALIYDHCLHPTLAEVLLEFADQVAATLLAKLQEQKPAFRDTYFVHELRGTKGGLVTRTSSGTSCLSHALKKWLHFDRTLQIKELAGFHATTANFAAGDGITYMQAYCTEKNVIYQLNPGLFTCQQPKELLEKKTKQKIVEDLDVMSQVFYECAGEGDVVGHDGCAHLEIWIPLDKAQDSLVTLPRELVERSVVAINRRVWWLFIYYCLAAIHLVLKNLAKADPRQVLEYLEADNEDTPTVPILYDSGTYFI
ncbi:hypothetical protein EDB19DRAFT_1827125 [Suillus lakei]|nr:hypothetical protein EDB19DRAFT_1827125 [Suillus lakei]